MKIYYDPVSGGFYQDNIHNKIPATALQITDKRRWELINGQSSDTTIVVKDNEVTLQKKEVSVEDKVIIERLWRDAELSHVDIELNKVQDSDLTAVGTVSQWREYRKVLRRWPEHKDFPNKEKRPVSPMALKE